MQQKNTIGFDTDLEYSATELDVNNAETEGDKDQHEAGHELEPGLDELHVPQLGTGPGGGEG
jgi:hypothetical protein